MGIYLFILQCTNNMNCGGLFVTQLRNANMGEIEWEFHNVKV